MPVNYYDQAAQAPLMNTYVPIDFTNLYRIAATQKAYVDQAMKDLNTATTRFGEFRSPSSVDTLNYYNLTLGQMQDLFDEMETDPDAIKDASWRSRLYSRLNNLDYAALSQLQEGAEAERTRQENVAKMQQQGTYNANWDDIDVSNYDTLRNGVLNELAPIPYMSADTLSNPYYSNLSKGYIGSTYRNGARYLLKGNTVEDLEAVADAHMNDLIATPQGRMYMRDFLRRNNGNEELARSDFRDMIVASQMDRTLRPELEVDPAWLATARANSRGTTNTSGTSLNRRELLQNGLSLRVESAWDNYRRNNMTQEQVDKYNKDSAETRQAYIQALSQFRTNPTEENRQAAVDAEVKWRATEYGPKNAALQKEALDAFYEHSGGPDDRTKFRAEKGDEEKGYSRERYKYGVQAGLDAISVPVDIGQDDRLLTQVGGVNAIRTNNNGIDENVYSFRNSSGFLLPETVFAGITGVQPRDQRRADVALARREASRALPFQSCLEGGLFNNIQFVSDGELIQTGSGQTAVKGTIKIPVDEVLDKVGWGTRDGGFSFFRIETTRRALNKLYGAEIVEEPVGNDNVDFYEFTGYRLLAPWDPQAGESNVAVDQSWMNTSTYGGIGTSSLATDNYGNAVINALTQ